MILSPLELSPSTILLLFFLSTGGNSIKFLMEFTRANFLMSYCLSLKNNINVENFEGPQVEAYEKLSEKKTL